MKSSNKGIIRAISLIFKMHVCASFSDRGQPVLKKEYYDKMGWNFYTHSSHYVFIMGSSLFGIIGRTILYIGSVVSNIKRGNVLGGSCLVAERDQGEILWK